MRRRTLLVILGTAFLLTLGAFWSLSSPRPVQIPRDVLERIQPGMTMADIEGIVGSPPGDYRSGPVVEIPDTSQAVSWEEEEEWTIPGIDLPKYKWETDTAELEIMFLKSGRAAVGWFTEVEQQKIGSLDSLIWRTKRLWRRGSQKGVGLGFVLAYV